MKGYESDLTGEAFEKQEEEFEELFDKAIMGEFDEEDREDNQGQDSGSSGEDHSSQEQTEEGSNRGTDSGEEATGEGSGESGEADKETGEEQEGDDEEVGMDGEGETEEEDTELLDDDEELLRDPKKLLQRYKTLQGMWRAEREKSKKTQQQSEQEVDESGQSDESKSEDNTLNEDLIRKLTEEEEKFVENILNEDDKFKEIKEDFPEVAEALERSLKKALSQYSVKQTAQMMAILQQSVAPVIQQVQERTLVEHYQAIKEAHPDFEKYVNSGEIEAWIKAQPPRKQKYYMEVYQEGSTEEVIDLLNEFKESLGIDSDTGKKSKKTKKQESASNKEVESDKRLGDMEDVNTRSRAVDASKSQAPIDDFEAAFEEALRN